MGYEYLNRWTHEYTDTHDCLICRQQIRYSCCQRPDSLIPNSCQRVCLQLPHRAQLALWCVWSTKKWIQVCTCNVYLCGCMCVRWPWARVRACARMKASFTSLSAIILSLGQNHRVAADCTQGIYPSSANLQEYSSAGWLSNTHVYAHSLSHPLPHVSQTLVTLNFIKIPNVLCLCQKEMLPISRMIFSCVYMFVIACVILGWQVNMSVCVCASVIHLLPQLSGFGFTGFHLGLVHHVVCRYGKKRGGKVVDKIRACEGLRQCTCSCPTIKTSAFVSLTHAVRTYAFTVTYTLSKHPVCLPAFLS